MYMKKHKLIKNALELRSKNLSLKEISKELKISKSTASSWLKDTPKKKISWLGRKKMLDALKRGRENSLKNRRIIPLEELQSKTSIKSRVFKLRGRICEICKWSEKNPFYDEIPVEIHHIDGNKKNNKDTNLVVLCPNCHSLTNHYGFFGRTHKNNVAL